MGETKGVVNLNGVHPMSVCREVEQLLKKDVARRAGSCPTEGAPAEGGATDVAK